MRYCFCRMLCFTGSLLWLVLYEKDVQNALLLWPQDQCLASGGAVILSLMQAILRWAARITSLQLSLLICIYRDSFVYCFMMLMNKLMHWKGTNSKIIMFQGTKLFFFFFLFFRGNAYVRPKAAQETNVLSVRWPVERANACLKITSLFLLGLVSHCLRSWSLCFHH